MFTYLHKCKIQAMICSGIIVNLLCFKEATVVKSIYHYMTYTINFKALYIQVVGAISAILS